MKMNECIKKLDRIHPYPAKFPIEIAAEYINKYTQVNDYVYDPFLGSGTTLLAAKFLNRNGYGTDVNHIAILISRFKLLNLTNKNFNNLIKFIHNFEKTYKVELKNVELKSYPSIDHWFCDDSIKILSLIINKINLVSNDKEKIFCQFVFSAIINSASNQESDTRYAAIVKPKLNVDYVANLFVKKFKNSLKICKQIQDLYPLKNVLSPVLLDSKQCTNIIKPKSISCILTSPPYPNTYDYYLYHKHRMNWLDYDVKFSMNKEIGSRREFSSLKKPKEKFNDDMLSILSECNKVLKLHGYIILIMGDGKIRGEIYDAKTNMELICSKLNWKLIDYSFTYLDQTSRSFQQSYRTKGKKEHILVFRKE